MPRVLIYPNKYGWASARKLKEQLPKSLLICSESSDRFYPKNEDIIINWGNSKDPANWIWEPGHVINEPASVFNAVNKVRSFIKFTEANVQTPEWTIDENIARTWKGDIVCRTNLIGFGGDGISFSTRDNLVGAPLYVKYKKKKHEYRVHVFNGEVIDISWKRKKNGVEANTKIRNYANGWVYCRDDLYEPAGLRPLALAAVASLDLVFGAVDIIWNEKEDKCYVLEVNSAPGLVGTTLESYGKAFRSFIQN
jgi:glutathione synthase/RimK-type ligase-like ATP-grasp enzyme